MIADTVTIYKDTGCDQITPTGYYVKFYISITNAIIILVLVQFVKHTALILTIIISFTLQNAVIVISILTLRYSIIIFVIVNAVIEINAIIIFHLQEWATRSWEEKFY